MNEKIKQQYVEYIAFLLRECEKEVSIDTSEFMIITYLNSELSHFDEILGMKIMVCEYLCNSIDFISTPKNAKQLLVLSDLMQTFPFQHDRD